MRPAERSRAAHPSNRLQPPRPLPIRQRVDWGYTARTVATWALMLAAGWAAVGLIVWAASWLLLALLRWQP